MPSAGRGGIGGFLALAGSWLAGCSAVGGDLSVALDGVAASVDASDIGPKDDLPEDPDAGTRMDVVPLQDVALPPDVPVPVAFPGAEGFGARATGGRGGSVCLVTNLDASGRRPGSFQWCLDQPGRRYVLFRVSGVIPGTVSLTRGDVTIAGQTSPGGITVRGIDIQGNVVCEADGCPLPTLHPENFIVRHVRSRPSAAVAGVDEDGLRLHRAANGIVDHLSVGNALDEAVQVSFTRDVTIQATLIAETVGGGAEYGGMLVQYSDPTRGFPLTRLSIHHNTWNRIRSRLPALNRDNASANRTVMEIELSNNLLWDPGFYVDPVRSQARDESAILFYRMNWVGNFGHVRGPGQVGAYPYGLMNSEAFVNLPAGHPTRIFFADDRMNLYPDRRDYQLIYCCDTYASTLSNPRALPFPDDARRPSFAAAERLPFPPITYTPSAELRAWMVRHVGAFPRDPMDRRLMAPVGAGAILLTARDQNPVGDALSVAFDLASPPRPPPDGDDDGMPDAWETAHGLDPRGRDHNGFALGLAPDNGVAGCIPGYTNLECYLNELAEQRVATGR